LDAVQAELALLKSAAPSAVPANTPTTP